MDIKPFLKSLPNQPGVYQMYDKHGKLLYVGKAKNLSNRVRSYFQKNIPSVKTASLMSQVEDVQITVTDSDTEALLLESNLIKQHRPRYNVLLRDDKSYPYLYLSTHHQFPRLDFHRGAKRAPGRYFGPFPNAGAVRENLALIQKLFRLRQCKDSFFANRTRPCLQYQIKRCTAPCVGYVSELDYRQQVDNAILFLEGKNQAVIDTLVTQMENASKKKEYEEAAMLRDLVARLRKLQTQQCITGDEGDVDILGVAAEANHIAVSVLFVRAGRMIGNKTFFPKTPKGTTPAEALLAFIPQYYLSPLRGETVVEKIIVDEKLEEKQWLEEALQKQLASRISIVDRKQKQLEQWRRMASNNAKFSLATHLAQQQQVAHKLESLQQALKLPNSLQRIECFDVSHTMGEATVASCVVFDNEGPAKKDYRRFNITGITPGDDYAALRQALTRRYKRLKSEDGVLPDLLIIDGGLGQMQQANEVLEELQVSGVELLGVAKGPSRKAGLEHLYIGARKEPLSLAPDSSAMLLIQQIRDEAHRFAIAAHRAQRGKARSSSPLEGVEGVGPKRRQALLRHFGGWQELSKAGVADIAKVPGVSQALAQKIYDALH